MGLIIKDISFAIRMFLKNPWPSLVAIIAFAFGIRTNAAIFSAVNVALPGLLSFKGLNRLSTTYAIDTKISQEKMSLLVADDETSCVPARRETKVDTIITLRSE